MSISMQSIWNAIHVASTRRCSPHLITHGTTYSVKVGLVAIADRHLCAMGVPVFPLDGPEAQAAMPVSPMVAALKPLKHRQKIHVIGNGIPVQLLVARHFYDIVLSNVRRKPDQSWTRSVIPMLLATHALTALMMR